MTDKTSVPKTILILGATSAVAVAFARQACKGNAPQLILAGRNEDRLNEIRMDLVARGASETSSVIVGDLGDPANVAGLYAKIIDDAGVIDDVLLAYGILGDQSAQQADMKTLRSLIDVNLTSAAMWCEAVAATFEAQGHGRLAVIGSVAGDRGRQSNYLYGATKGALERLCEGMAHRFAGNKDITVTIVKPGFIDTPMTDHIEGKGGPLWATPEKVASVIHLAMNKRRVRVYAPWIWRWILLIVRALPVPVMHKTKM